MTFVLCSTCRSRSRSGLMPLHSTTDFRPSEARHRLPLLGGDRPGSRLPTIRSRIDGGTAVKMGGDWDGSTGHWRPLSTANHADTNAGSAKLAEVRCTGSFRHHPGTCLHGGSIRRVSAGDGEDRRRFVIELTPTKFRTLGPLAGADPWGSIQACTSPLGTGGVRPTSSSGACVFDGRYPHHPALACRAFFELPRLPSSAGSLKRLGRPDH
ncbi:hypothetical protein ShzoTeo12_53600 (plasmid) [Shinella zoogloeoides]|nr:hypothetical protein ShzoTeo12_53600 [Shinella zoogloeoides]